jgi:hypothetical protein
MSDKNMSFLHWVEFEILFQHTLFTKLFPMGQIGNFYREKPWKKQITIKDKKKTGAKSA